MKFLETAPALRPFQREHTADNVFQVKYLQTSSASIVENQLNNYNLGYIFPRASYG